MSDRDISRPDTTGNDYNKFNEEQPKLPEYNINIVPNFYQDNLISRIEQLNSTLMEVVTQLSQLNIIINQLTITIGNLQRM